MALRPLVLFAVFAAGVAFAVWVPGVMTALRPGVVAKKEAPQAETRAAASGRKQTVAMTDDRIKLAEIEQAKGGPG